MSAGTLTLTNGSDAIVGVGTSFTADLGVGDYIFCKVNGTPYTMPVKSVTTDTGVIVTANYTGPNASDIPWTSVPQDIMSFIGAALGIQSAEAMRQLNNDKDNWLQVYTDTSANITVKIGNGLTFTGPSWKHISHLLADIDVPQLQAIADQIHSDAEQVAADSLSASNSASAAASSEQTATNKATEAAGSASAAATSEGNASTSAQTSTDKATEAAASATEAANSAASVHPENLLQKANQLSELSAAADAAAARGNLSVFSKAEIADLLPGYLGQVEWQEMRSALQPGTIPRDGQEVDQTGIYANLYAKAAAGKLPTCTEAEWQADPLKRGCYVLNSSPGKMRLPDDNGVQPGSLKIPVKVGDAGDATKAGKMGGSALPNITGNFNGLYSNASVNATGVFKNTKAGSSSGSGSGTSGGVIHFSASDDNPIYQDGVTEVRPNRQHGCWTVRIAAKATNGGSIDALALATAIASGDADLLAKINATNSRLDYALISPSGSYASNTRTMYGNPFGNDIPVICIAEFFHATLQKWISTVYTWTGSNASYGLQAAFQDGEGISVVSGQTGFGISASGNGASVALPANYSTASPIRIHVWKITA